MTEAERDHYESWRLAVSCLRRQFVTKRARDLRQLRQQRRLKAMSLAAEIGISPQHLSACERGIRRPSQPVLERWERALA